MNAGFEEVVLVAQKPDLAGFLMTWCNASDPELCEQALLFWSENARAFGPVNSRRRVTPGKPPGYPRR